MKRDEREEIEFVMRVLEEAQMRIWTLIFVLLGLSLVGALAILAWRWLV